MASVRLVTSMGTDATIVNAARVSYGKHVEPPLSDGDVRLISYLVRHRHMSPFRHCYVTLHCRQPEFVARQAYKVCILIRCFIVMAERVAAACFSPPRNHIRNMMTRHCKRF
jgi:hypothetical protein